MCNGNRRPGFRIGQWQHLSFFVTLYIAPLFCTLENLSVILNTRQETGSHDADPPNPLGDKRAVQHHNHDHPSTTTTPGIPGSTPGCMQTKAGKKLPGLPHHLACVFDRGLGISHTQSSCRSTYIRLMVVAY